MSKFVTAGNGNKRVLITGASGFIGSHVLAYLLEKTDWTFVCPCSFRHKGNPLRIKSGDRVEVPTLDLTGEIPDLGDFDYILNLASESHVTRSIQEPVEFIENNVSLTIQLLEYARKHKPKVFIQFSTDEVYGDGEVSGEWSVLLPSNPYSASKAAQEMIAIAYWRTYGVPVVITNTNNIIGENQDKEKFVPLLVDKITKGEVVGIHTNNGRLGSRFYNYADNVADGLLFILNQFPQGFMVDVPHKQVDRPDRYGLGGGKEMDNLEMAQAVAKELGKELKYELVSAHEERPGYDQTYAHPGDKLEKLGWTPPVSFEEGLKRAVGN